MKHIHWLLPGQNHNLQSIQNNILASVRLRAYVSSINTKSFTFSFGENMPLKTDVLVIGKIGNFDLARRTKNWLNQIQMSSFSNNKIILDYTDNHLMINSPMTNFYRSILPFITIATTPSKKMSSIFSNFWKGPIETINDSIEVEINEWKKDKSSKKLLWFGHSTNVIYLLNFIKKNQSLLKKYSINIITNQIGIDYFNQFNQTNLNFETKLWSIKTLLDESKSCDVCIIPSDKSNSQKQGAGHNRLITGLALGMPIIATTLPSYSEFKDYFIDDENDKVKDVLHDPNIIKNKVILAQKKIVPLFSKVNLSKKWHKVFSK